MTVTVTAYDFTPGFNADMAGAPIDCRKAARDALNLLKANSQAKTLRLHALKGYGKPTIYKIDVYANSSWQITFEMVGTKAVLRRLGTHKEIDRRPR